jgi:hypothetical protein
MCLVVAGVLVANVFWHLLDHTLPCWDSACHLMKAYEYQQLFHHPRQLLRHVHRLMDVSIFYPPLIYMIQGGFKTLLPFPIIDLASRFVYLALLSGTVFAHSRILSGSRLAAVLSVLLLTSYPGLSYLFHSDLLDLPLIAMISAGLLTVTCWTRSRISWKTDLLCGAILSLCLFSKQTAVMFLGPVAALQIGSRFLSMDWRRGITLGGIWLVACSPMLIWMYCVSSKMSAFLKDNHLNSAASLSTFLDHVGYYGQALLQLLGPAAFVVFGLSLCVRPREIAQRYHAILLASVVGFFLIALINCVPQARYVAPCLIAIAMLSGQLLSELLAAAKIQRAAAAVLLAACLVTGFTISFSPSPVPSISVLEDILGISWLRLQEESYAVSRATNPTFPHLQDWKQASVLRKLTSRSTGQWLNVLSDSEEYNSAGLQYLALRERLDIKPTGFRAWYIDGHGYKYDLVQLNSVRWHLVLRGPQLTALQQRGVREFKSSEDEANYKRLLALLKEEKFFTPVVEEQLPQGLFLVVYEKRENSPISQADVEAVHR